MGKLTYDGIGIFNDKLDNLVREVHGINRMALYDASEYVADEVKKELRAMPCRRFEYTVEGWAQYGPTESEKEQIIENFGIAPFHDLDSSIGFHDYVETPSAMFNDKVPTGYLMQAIEYGTEFRIPLHTVTNAIKSIKDKVKQIIQSSIDERVNNIMNQ